MENFIVSARKYRPATFDTVVGQKSITNTLKNAIKTNHLAQAYLFTGPRGVGKTTTARIFAKTINCMNLDTENIEACNQCESCKSFATNSSFNIYELDAASNNSVDDIRQLVEQVRIPPQVGKFKIYIIDEVHMLSNQAFNAFLKTLEEPPSYVKFILATTERHKIIPTILSRCQVFNFNRIMVKDMAEHLGYVASRENVFADEDSLHLIAEKADGALRDALSMFDQLVSLTSGNLFYKQVVENLHVLDLDYYFRITSEILKGNISTVLVLLNQVLEKGFDGQHFIIGLGEHLRNLMISRDASTIELMDTSLNIKEKYKNQAPLYEVGFLIKCLDLNNQCDINYRTSNNKRLLLEITLMQMCGLANGLLENEGAEKKKIELKKNDVPLDLLTENQSVDVSLERPQAPNPPKTNVLASPVVEKILDQTPLKTAEPSPETISTPQPLEPKTSEKPKEINPSKFGKPSLGSTRNLGFSLNFDDETDVKPEDETAYMVGKEHIVTPIDQDLLQEIIHEFIQQLNNQPSLQSALTDMKPELLENFVIEFKLYNDAQQAELMKHLEGLLKKLRIRLNNYHITLKTTIFASKEFKANGAVERFNYFAEKNPNILKLKEQLNLEIDS